MAKMTTAEAQARRAPKDWHCSECHEWFTLKAAKRRMVSGCLKGCSGVDIDHYPDGLPLPAPTPTPRVVDAPADYAAGLRAAAQKREA